MRLTKRIIDATPCPLTGETWLADDSLPGFGVRLRAGRKTYTVRYRTPTGQPRRETLGLTTVLTLDQARALAQALLVAVRQGQDPAAHRQASRHGPTVVDLAGRYLRDHAEVTKKRTSLREDRRYIRDWIVPVLGTKRVQHVTRQDAVALHHRMRATPFAANRCLALLSHMFTMAETWGLREPRSNPVYGLTAYREPSRLRYLTGEELARLGTVLRMAQAQRSEHPSILACIRLLLLTGARLGEILTLRWGDIQAARGLALLRDSKTGPKPLYLSSHARQVLTDLPRVNAFVLGEKRAPSSHRVAWYRLRAAAGLEDVRLHDLRHSYASTLVGAGVSLAIIGRLLGHTDQATTQRYAHLADDPVRLAAEQAGVLVGHVLDGEHAG